MLNRAVSSSSRSRLSGQFEEKLLKGSVAEYDVLHPDAVVVEDGKYRGHIFVEAFVPFDMNVVLFNL